MAIRHEGTPLFRFRKIHSMQIILFLLLGLALLYYGANWLVSGGVNIAARTRISPLVIGLTLIAFATSAPEMVVSVDAAVNGMGDLSIGNILGSNICNIALILGLSAMVCPLSTSAQVIRFDTPVMILCTLVFVGGLWFFGGIGHLFGSVLFAGFILYTLWSVFTARRNETKSALLKEECEAVTAARSHLKPLWQGVIQAVVGLAALIGGGKLLINGAIDLGQTFGISEAVIALTVVAIGTSLPELATSVVAAMHGQRDIAVGNVIGSNIFNILGIMGLVGIIQPVTETDIDWVSYAMITLTALLVLPLMRSGFVISRKEGALLLLIYIGYTTYLVHSVL